MSGQTTKPPFWERQPWKAARWLAAVIVFVGTTLTVLASYGRIFNIASCRDVASNSGGVVSVCGPIGLSDVVAVGLVLGVASLLIWPELSEVGIPGLLTLKRRVDATERQAEQTAADVRGLTYAQEVPDAGVVADANAALERTARPEGNVFSTETGIRVVSRERGDAERELARLVSRIDRFLAIPMSSEPYSLLGQAAREGLIEIGDRYEQLRRIKRWVLQYDEQLRVWALIRNQIVHVPERLSDEQVRQGVELGHSLLLSLHDYLQTEDAAQ